MYYFLANKSHKWYQLFQLSPFLADFNKSEKCQQTLTPTFDQSCFVSKIAFKSDAIFYKTDIHQFSSQRNYISFDCVKLLNGKIEARESMKNNCQGSFVVQQKNLLMSSLGFIKSIKSFPGEFGCGSKDRQ